MSDELVATLGDEHWIELIGLIDDPALAAFIKNVGRKYAGSPVVNDWQNFVEEILGELQVVVVTKAATWVGLPSDERRQYGFGLARNLTYQRVDKLRAEARKNDLMEVALSIDLSEHIPADPAALTDVQVVSILKTKITTTPGVRAIGWERLLKKAHRDDSLQALVKAALKAIREGGQVDTRPLTAVVVDWRTWAVDRLAQGMNLSVADAVADGAFNSPRLAARKLHDWFERHLHRNRMQLCKTQVKAAGLVAHLPVDKQDNAAEITAALINVRCRLENPHQCQVTQCLLHPAHGINLDSARAELKDNLKGKS